MQNPYLDRLQSAAQKSTRPRFASALILVLLAHARDNGLIDASRAELAAAVDRSHAYPARNLARTERLIERQRDLDLQLLQLETSHANGHISYNQMRQARERAIDSFLKEVRSPTLANVSRVLNELVRGGLLSVRYIDALGEYHPVSARGRLAEYRLTPPNSFHLDRMPAAARQNQTSINETFSQQFLLNKQNHSVKSVPHAIQLDLL
ncbi:hypothetical protein [Thalassospira mesophila]|nr:hypothetical protein [Thalassospira mesophila]